MGTHPIFESDFDCLTEMGRYRAEKEYVNLSFTTRMVATVTIIYSIALVFDFCSTSNAPFDLQKILDGEVWRLFTSFMWYGLTAQMSGSPIRYIFAMIGFLKYFHELDAGYFQYRKSHFCCVLGCFYAATVALAIYIGKPLFLGDSLRMAVITVWAELYYLDNFSCLAGMDLSRFKASSLPYVWVAVFSFLDYPFSFSVHTALHFQLFGIFMGQIYVYLARRNGWIPSYWLERRQGDLHEFIPPAEMFIYLVLALLKGGS